MSPLNPLQQLYRLEPSSSQFPAQVASILDGEEYKASVQTLQDGDSVWLVDFFDNALGKLDTTSPAFRTCLCELRRLSGIRQALPRSYTLPAFLLDIDDQPIVRGYYGDIHKGSLSGSKVRAKRLLTSSDEAGCDFAKTFYEEAVTWKRLEHANIVPLLGVTVGLSSFQLISDWIVGQNLTEHVKNYPDAYQPSLLFDISNGLEYLHSNDVVHGNLRGPNILVNGFGRARITDFGLAMMPQNPAFKRDFFNDQTARWTAPEILHESGTYSKKADVFAFAMVMIEVFTGAVPFGAGLPAMAAIAIMQGRRPPRPTNLACSDKLWVMMGRCWDKEPLLRPEVSEVFQALPTSAPDQLRRLYQSGKASHEFRLALDRFYGDAGYEDCIDGLHGEDLKEFVDFLDTVLRTEGLELRLLQQTLHNLRRVCGRRTIIPRSHIIPDGLCKSNNRSLEANQYPEILVGKFNRLHGGNNQNYVHVRVMKFEKTQKEFYGEIVTWAWLDHPNILRCFGITADPLQVVIEWAAKGNVIEFAQRHADADRVCLLIDVAQGLDHLHSHGVIHKGLNSKNILVDAAGHACLSDIGLTTFSHNEELETDGSESSSTHCSRWIAPEVLKDGKFSKESDLFSLGFVFAEILGGELLWKEFSVAEVRSKISCGDRPYMPKGKVEFGVTVETWEMLTKCWEVEAEERVTISDVVNFLRYTPQPISGTSDILKRAIDRSQRQPSQELVDELDEGWYYILERSEITDQERSKFLRILRKLCSHLRSVPKSMRIAGYNKETISELHGGSASVFRGEYRGRPVAIKVVRLYLNDLEKYLSRFCKEAIIWKHLRHPNILPLLGVDFGGSKYAMISEWMNNGNASEFIQKHKEANRIQLLVDATLGLDYMHNLQFVHGDLKGANILVTKDGRACLADFGLSTVVRATHQGAPNDSDVSLVSITPGGTLRWMSPELLYPDKFGAKDSRPTTQSDCYALGMVVYEILVGKVPHWDIPVGYVVMDAVLKGVRPKKPDEAASLGFTDGLWRVVERCWMVDTDARPDVKTILHHLTHAASIWNRRQIVQP